VGQPHPVLPDARQGAPGVPVIDSLPYSTRHDAVEWLHLRASLPLSLCGLQMLQMLQMLTCRVQCWTTAAGSACTSREAKPEPLPAVALMKLRLEALLLDSKAEALIRARLEVTPDEARLWCALGDLRMDDACYERAWERSGKRSARAQRSIARR